MLELKRMFALLKEVMVAHWFIEVIGLWLSVLLLVYCYKLVNSYLHRSLLKTRRVWDDLIVMALYKPIQFIFLSQAVIFTIYFTWEHYGLALSSVDLKNNLQKVVWIVACFWFGIRFVASIENRLMQRSQIDKEKIDRTTVRGICQFVRIVIILFVGLFGLESFGVGLSALLAFGGFSSVAVAFAAKDLLSNFFGGFMVFYDRPFSVGDWIRSPDKDIEGTVEHIGWRLTRIKTFSKRPLYVPNSLFSIIAIENPSRMSNRRIKSLVGLRYQDYGKLSVVTDAIALMLKDHPDIDQQQTSFVKMVNFGASSLDILVYTFTKTTNWVRFQAVQQDVFLKIIAIIDSHGAACAFPTTTLDMPDRFDAQAALLADDRSTA